MARQPIDKRRIETVPPPEAKKDAASSIAPVRSNPANENDPTTAMMIRRLRRPPSYDVIYMAAVVAAIWAAGWFWLYKGEIAGQQAASPTGFMQALALLFFPVVGILVIAYFLWRTQQLRQTSEILMTQAMRLIRPGDVAAEGLTTLATQVRREVDVLVGSMDHAMQRATALEDIVHKEITAVERAFGSNEERIRGLVNGLETQRAALQQASNLVAADAQPLLQRMETNTQSLNQVVNMAMTTFSRIEEGLKSSSGDLSRTIDDVTVRAAETSRDLGNHTMQFERISTMLSSDFRGLQGQMQDYLENLSFTANNLGNETRKFTSDVRDMEQNLAGMMQQGTAQLIASHAETADSLARITSQTSDQWRKHANDIAATMQAATDNHARALSEAQARFEANAAGLHQGLSNITDGIGGQIAAAAGRFDTALQMSADNHAKALAESHARFDANAKELHQNIAYVADQATGQWRETADGITSALQASADNHLRSLADANARFEANTSAFHANVAGITDAVTGQWRATADSITGALQDSTDNHVKALADANARFEASTGAFHANVAGITDQVTGQWRVTADSIASALQSSTDEHVKALADANARFETSASSLNSNLSAIGSQVVEQWRQAADGVAGELQTNTQAHIKALATSNAQFDSQAQTLHSTLAGMGDTINAQWRETAEGITSALQTSADEHVKTLAEANTRFESSTTNLHQAINRSASQITQDLRNAGSNVNDMLISTSGTIAAHLKETADIVNRQMQDSGITLSQTIELSGGAVTDRLISVSGEFVDRLDRTRDGLMTTFLSTSGEMITKLEETSSGIYSRMSDARLGLTEQLNGVTSELGGLITTTQQRISTQLEQAATEIDSLFTQNGRMLTEQLENSSNIVTLSFAETAGLAADKLNRAGIEASGKMEDASQSMFKRLQGTTLELGKRFDAASVQLEETTNEIARRMDGHGTRFSQVMDDASANIFDSLARARDAFAEGLTETTLRISGRFEQESGLLVDRIDKSVTEFDQAASDNSARLQEATDKFSKHMAGSQSILAQQLSAAAQDIDQRLEGVSTQLTGKLENTGTRISERLDDVSALVSKSIDKFNLEMEHMLVSRRDMLEGLATDANRRATELDKILSSYTSLIEDSLAAAEERARNLGRIVNDQSNAALSNLEEQLRKLETSSTGQVSQAARALREQHERALANMNEMLSSTASDFQQTAQDMRLTAQQVVKDIDAARGDLKRAMSDLPEETRSNADAMRRVVADQINALNALSEVVRKQTGSIDYSAPGFSAPRSAAPARQEPAYSSAASAPARIATAQVRQEAAPSSSRLSGLAREVENSKSKLDLAARDVVEAIEGQLPRDLERRFSGSDKGVYTARLYEARSRKLIKALENRYAEERLLRSRVQAYNRQFEKLLDSISETDGADQVMEQVLQSDQGRIYVMLAEVAGRMPSQG